MYDEAQTLYINEVLGLRADLLVGGVASPEVGASLPRTELLILHQAATPEEQGLLKKILETVPLPTETIHLTFSELEFAEGAGDAKRVLAFNGKNCREILGQQTWWQLPELAQMIGAGVQVTSFKKLAWGLLQDLAGDLRD